MQDKFSDLMDDLFDEFHFDDSAINLADLLDFGMFLARRYGVMPVYPFPMIYSTFQNRIALQTIQELLQSEHWSLAQFEKFLLRCQQLYMTQLSNWQQLAGPYADKFRRLMTDAEVRYLPLKTLNLLDQITFKPINAETFFDTENVSWYQNTAIIKDFDKNVTLPGNISIFDGLSPQLKLYSPEGKLFVSDERLVHQYNDSTGETILKQLQLSKISTVRTYRDAVLIWLDQLPLILKTDRAARLGTILTRLIEKNAETTFVRSGFTVHDDHVDLSVEARNQFFQQAKAQLTKFAASRFELTMRENKHVLEIHLVTQNRNEAKRLHELVQTNDVVKWNQVIAVPLLQIMMAFEFIDYDVDLSVNDSLSPGGPYTLIEILYGHLTVNLGVGLVHKIHRFQTGQLLMDLEAGLLDQRSLKYF